MKRNKNILSLLLSLAILVSTFSFPAFAAEEKTGKAPAEVDFLNFESEDDLKKMTKGARANTEFVKSGLFSAEFRLSEVDGCAVYSMPSDMSAFNELKLTLYSTGAFCGYLHFVTDNSATDGSDYYGLKVDFTEGWQTHSFDLSEIGYNRSPSWASISSFNISCTGWGLTKNPDITIYLDSAVLSKNPNFKDVEVPEPPKVLPDGKAGIVRYYENDFEASDSVSANEKDNKITVETENSNRYLKFSKTGEKDMHFDINLKDTSRYMVVSLDIASNKIPKGNTQLITLRSEANSLSALILKGTGEITAAGKTIGKIKADSKWTNIAVSCDFVNSVYSAYINNELVAEKLPMSNSAFGQPWLFRIFLNAGEDKKASLWVDNLRLFDGLSPADFENTYDPETAAKKTFEKLIGTPSPAIEYGTEALAKIDEAKGVMINVHSGYIYANGKRTLPDAAPYIKNGRTLLPVRAISEALGCKVDWNSETRTVTINDSAKIAIDQTHMILPDKSTYTLDVPAEITADRTFIPLRALCEKVLSKTVFWNDRGLIVLTDNEIEIKEADIKALNNYMLYTRPSADELVKLFNENNKNTHPRVIITKEKLNKILSDIKTNELMGKWADRVLTVANQYLDKPHETHTLTNNQLLSQARNVLGKSLNLSMAYHITGDMKYADYLAEEMKGVCSFADWNHKNHYLDVGEMATGVAIAYDWLYDIWTPELRKTMEQAIYKNAIMPTQLPIYGEGDYGSLMLNTTNWNAVCNGGVGTSAIAIFDVYPKECSDILEKHYVALENMMTEFYPNGAWYEGAGYWEYLMQYMAFFISSTDAAFKTDFNITKAPGFSGTGEYIIASDGMTGVNNFHDSGVSHLVSNQVFWLSDVLTKPELAQINLYKMQKYNKTGDIYSLMYYDTSISPATDINLPLDTYFGGTEIVNLRSSLVDDGGIFASFHSGKNNVNHAHLDAGTFVVDIGGQRFAGDIGAESYQADGYWGAKRYQYYRARPEGHNVFVINPDESFGQDTKGIADFSHFVSKPRGAFAITDISSSYKSYADSARRGIMLSDERRSVLIRDEIRGMKKDKNEVYWFMQLEKLDAQILDNKTVILTKNGIKVKLCVESDADDCEIFITDPVVLPTSENLPNQTANTGWKRLAIKLTSGRDININVKMSLAGDPLGDSPIEDISLDSWSIPDGEIPDFPRLNSIEADGVAIKNFDKLTTFYNHILSSDATKAPLITATADSDKTVTITQASTLPGSAVITVTDNNNSKLQTVYTVYMRPANEVEIEVSAEQEGNEGVKSLDKDLNTRWAVEGEGWGIYTFDKPKTISSVWIAAWKSDARQLIFDIEVSADGESFTQVFSGKSTSTEDKLTEYKIPEGTYKAVKLVLHGTTTSTWNSILEVEFK